MAVSTMFAIYFIIWWTVLFAVLPWGIHSQEETGDIAPGTDPGAPALPNLLRKGAWTTVISAVIFGIFYTFYVYHWISLDDLGSLFGLLR
jgi:predicted secreted protein